MLKQMAYNSTYETIYGFDSLDTFHNFFPEMMYDDELFNNEMVSWMRHRLNTLFPAVYPRQQNLYRIYVSQTRRGLFRTFQTNRINNRNNNMIRPPMIHIPVRELPQSPIATTPVPTPVPTTMPMPTTVAVPMTVPTPVAAIAAIATPTAAAGVRTPAFRVSAMQDPMEDLLYTLMNTANQPRQNDTLLLASMLGSLGSIGGAGAGASAGGGSPGGVGGLGSLLGINSLLGNRGAWTTAGTELNNTLWADVPIVPTIQQVQDGSDIVELIDVPEEVLCAICQERGTVTPWRFLYCEHYFHRACVDRWFTRNVNCPVCRADIRMSDID